MKANRQFANVLYALVRKPDAGSYSRRQEGDSLMRHTLYMGTLNAKKTNGTCKELFDRLVAEGKNKKPAIIAVANKLLKRVFGVVKNECLFYRNYYKKIA